MEGIFLPMRALSLYFAGPHQLNGGVKMLALATACVGHVGSKLFHSFFVHVPRVMLSQLGLHLPRQYVIRVPTYYPHTVG